MDKINKYLPLLSFLGVITGVIGGVYFFGGFMNQMESGTVTPEEKVKILNHVNAAPTDVEMYKALETFDSVLEFQKAYNLETQKQRAKKDSLNKLEQVTIYQLKQSVEKIEKKLDNE